MTTDNQVTLEDVNKTIEANSEDIAELRRLILDLPESDAFTNAVKNIVREEVTGIVKAEVAEVFDNHMSEIKKMHMSDTKKMFAQLGKALSDLGQEK